MTVQITTALEVTPLFRLFFLYSDAIIDFRKKKQEAGVNVKPKSLQGEEEKFPPEAPVF